MLSDFFFLQFVTRHIGEGRGVGHCIAKRNIKLYVSLRYTVVLSLEDDAIVKVLLFEDSGDEVIPSGCGRCSEDDAICSMILVMMSFLPTVVKVKLQGKWYSAKNVVSTPSRDVYQEIITPKTRLDLSVCDLRNFQSSIYSSLEEHYI